MALQAKLVPVDITAAGAKSVSGVGFQPKLVLFFGNLQAAAGGQANALLGIGAATSSTQEGCVASNSRDNTTTGTTGSIVQNDACFVLNNQPGATHTKADFTSMDADGFTINVATFTAAVRVMALCLGGADLTNAYVGSRQMPAGTGAFATTGVGFQGDALILIGGGEARAGFADSPGGDHGLSIGVALSSTQRYCAAVGADSGVADMVTASIQMNDRCLAFLSGTTVDNLGTALDFVSWDSDGFTLNKISGATATDMVYIVLKGGQYAVGDVAHQAGTGQFSETVGFQPSALLLFGTNRATAYQSAPVAEAELVVGAATSTTEQACAWILDADTLASSDNQQRLSQTRISIDYDRTGGNTFAAAGELGFTSFGATGFTLEQHDGNPTAWLLPYLAIGSAAAGGGASGAGTAAAPGFDASGAGVVPVAGAGAAAPRAFTVAGAGAVPNAGAGAGTLPGFDAAAAGTARVAGAASAAAPGFDASGAGRAAVAGTGGASAPAFNAVGSSAQTIAGAGAAAIRPFGASGSAQARVQGVGAATGPAFASSGAGAASARGTGTATLPAMGGSGTATIDVAGAGGAEAPGFSASGLGRAPVAGSGAGTLAAFRAQGSTEQPGYLEGELVLIPRLSASTTLTPRLAPNSIEIRPRLAGELAIEPTHR